MCGCYNSLPNAEVPAIVNKQDMYLDSNNPIEVIAQSPQIQGLTDASISFYIEEKPVKEGKYVTANDQEAREYFDTIRKLSEENPESCTTLMKNLLPLIRKKALRKDGLKTRPPMPKNNPNQGLKKDKFDMYRSKKVVYQAKMGRSKAVPNNNGSQATDHHEQDPNPMQTIEVEFGDQTEVSNKPKDDMDFEAEFDKIVLSEEELNMRVVKAFVYLYTSPYIYKDLNEALTEKQESNYLRIVAFVVKALKNLPNKRLADFKLNCPNRFHLYRGLSTKEFSQLKSGYWKGFTSCSTTLKVAKEYASNGCLLRIEICPPMEHMYIKVPRSSEIAHYDEEEVILFPFFRYIVDDRNEESGTYLVREYKRERRGVKAKE